MDPLVQLTLAQRRRNREIALALQLTMGESIFGFSAVKDGERIDPRGLRPAEPTFTHYDELPRR